MLRLSEVVKRFGSHVALDRVSIHVRKGDCYGFLGHNGAGKTTALRIALGLISADGGRVLIDGFDAARHPREARARQGGLIETPGFHAWMSGRENLRLLAGLSGISRRDSAARADRLLEVVGLSSAGDRKVGGYSQGMRQRLGIAQALLGDPACFLLDEPLSSLDPEGIEELRRLLVRLTREEGRTVVLSSHQLSEVAGICNRIGILKAGRLVTEGETAELLADRARRTRLRTGDPDGAKRVLAGLGLEPRDAPDGALVFEAGETEPGAIARALVGEGVEVRELAPLSATLPEIYLRASHGSEGLPPGPGPAPAPVPPETRRAPRGPVRRALVAELRRLRSHAAPLVVLALPALLAAFSILEQWGRAAGHLAEVAKGDLYSHSLVTAFEAAAVALAAALPLAAYVVAGLASQSIAGEYGRGTLRNLLLRPVGRVPLSLGKASGLLLAALACYLLVVVAAVGGATLAFDFTDVVEVLEIRTAEPWVIAKADALRPVFLEMLAGLTVPLLAYAALGFLAGAVAKRSATGLALAAGAVLALDLARAVGRELGFEKFLLSAHLPSPFGDTSWTAHLLDLIRAPNDPAGGYTGSSLLVSLVWLVACVALATLLVRRRQVP